MRTSRPIHAGKLPARIFDTEGEIVPLRGRYTIEDGVEIVPTPGHTGGASVRYREVEKPEPSLRRDAAPLPENIEKRNITGMIYSTAQGLESIDLLRRIREPGLHLLTRERTTENSGGST